MKTTELKNLFNVQKLKVIAKDPIFNEPPIWGSAVLAILGIISITISPYASSLNVIGRKDAMLTLATGGIMVTGALLSLLKIHHEKNPIQE